MVVMAVHLAAAVTMAMLVQEQHLQYKAITEQMEV
jgi:hypothetical protein